MPREFAPYRLAHEMYTECGAVKPKFQFTPFSQPEYNQCAIATVLQFKIIQVSCFPNL